MSYSFKKQLKSFTFAWKGILTCAGHEQNITFHLIAAIIVLAAGFCFGISRTEWMVVMLCIGTVIAAELFNSAIAGEVKDIAAGAVLITAIAAAIVGMIVFLPYVIALF